MLKILALSLLMSSTVFAQNMQWGTGWRWEFIKIATTNNELGLAPSTSTTTGTTTLYGR